VCVYLVRTIKLSATEFASLFSFVLPFGLLISPCACLCVVVLFGVLSLLLLLLLFVCVRVCSCVD